MNGVDSSSDEELSQALKGMAGGLQQDPPPPNTSSSLGRALGRTNRNRSSSSSKGITTCNVGLIGFA